MKISFTSIMLLVFATVPFYSSAQLTVTEPEHYKVWDFANKKYEVKTIRLSTGVSLQYVEQGNTNGTPVILLHGITDSWHSFELVLPELPVNMHAFAISQRGHGDSERPVSGYSMKDFSNDLAAFIYELKLGKAIIVGHSMSGMIVQQFAIDHPEMVKGIVIIDSAPSLKNTPGMPEFVKQVGQLTDPVDHAFADEFQRSTLAKPIDPTYYDIVVKEGLKVPARVWKAAFEGLMQADYTRQLRRINVPVLIVWGDKDNFCSRADQDLFIRELKQSRFIIYPGTGHALHWEQPRQFAADLNEFVNKIDLKN